MNKQLRKQFDAYVSNFDENDVDIARKYSHSYRVMNIALELASNIKEYKDSIDLVEISGLLHDYGRFSQIEKYHTFSDIKSLDHADLGVKLLFDENKIKDFWECEEDYDKIYKAIKYHNKYEVPSNLNEEDKTLCNIIRDADKIDILFELTREDIPIVEEEGDIPLESKLAFEERRLVDRTKVLEPEDILLHLAFIFDINYRESYILIKEKNIIPKIYERIRNKEKYKPYFDKIENYIKEKVIEC